MKFCLQATQGSSLRAEVPPLLASPYWKTMFAVPLCQSRSCPCAAAASVVPRRILLGLPASLRVTGRYVSLRCYGVTCVPATRSYGVRACERAMRRSAIEGGRIWPVPAAYRSCIDLTDTYSTYSI